MEQRGSVGYSRLYQRRFLAKELDAPEPWIALEHLYSSRSKAKLLQLNIQLQTLKKGPLSISVCPLVTL